MPLLTSKNIWCPCLPHRLICNTFCCLFHLTNIAGVNNHVHFSYFSFLGVVFRFMFPFICSLVLYLLLSRVSVKRMARGSCVKFGAHFPFPGLPPAFFRLPLLGLDLVVVIPWRLPQSPVCSCSKKYLKNKHQTHLHTKRALH